jgi:hypothetical protein
MGQAIATMDRVGFHALANRGFSAANPPADVGREIASIVGELIELWTRGLADAGPSPTSGRRDLRAAGRRRAQLAAPLGAFATTGRPGFTTYPGDGVLDQIQDERAAHGSPAWASAEGTNLIPGDAVGTPGLTMEAHLARCFDHGATRVDLYGWSIGDPSNPFQTVAEAAASIAAYQKLLAP